LRRHGDPKYDVILWTIHHSHQHANGDNIYQIASCDLVKSVSIKFVENNDCPPIDFQNNQWTNNLVLLHYSNYGDSNKKTANRKTAPTYL
jgi:hypothetical protein